MNGQTREPAMKSVAVNGITLAFHEWAGAGGGDKPVLLFAHATGFHGRVFDQVIAHFPDHRVLSLDLRGHGRSEGGPVENWSVFSLDVVAFVDALDIRGAVGIGHSMGAHTLVEVAAMRGGAFERLILFDPVILAPDQYGEDAARFTADDPHPTIRRKRDFPSPEAMMERFATREPYCRFDARVFEDYCRYGLLPRPEGGCELACSPETEASIYMSSHTNAAIHDHARRIEVPALIVRAKQGSFADFTGSPTWPPLASTMPRGRDLHRPDRTHFHPFEDPTDAARIIAEAMAAQD